MFDFKIFGKHLCLLATLGVAGCMAETADEWDEWDEEKGRCVEKMSGNRGGAGGPSKCGQQPPRKVPLEGGGGSSGTPGGGQCNFRKTVQGTVHGTVSVSYVGPIYDMDDDPRRGGVNLGIDCLEEVNGYRRRHGLLDYTLRSLTNEQQCCLVAEAKYATDHGLRHFNARCLSGSWSQGGAGGRRGTQGSVEASLYWVPRMFYDEGPQGGHYQAMMRPQPRPITCFFYGADRESHTIFVNYH